MQQTGISRGKLMPSRAGGSCDPVDQGWVPGIPSVVLRGWDGTDRPEALPPSRKPAHVDVQGLRRAGNKSLRG